MANQKILDQKALVVNEITDKVKNGATFVVFNNNGLNVAELTELRRKLYKYAEMADIRKANPHALRHNQAVKLATICDTTEKVEIAAKRLGHSPSMFMNTYANHTNDAKQEELLSILYDKKA